MLKQINMLKVGTCINCVERSWLFVVLFFPHCNVFLSWVLFDNGGTIDLNIFWPKFCIKWSRIGDNSLLHLSCLELEVDLNGIGLHFVELTIRKQLIFQPWCQSEIQVLVYAFLHLLFGC